MDAARPLGRVVRDRRVELGLTQEQLAARIGNGVRQSEVSRLERGRVALPRRRRLEAIAAALDLSLGDLLARSGWAGAESVFAPPGSLPPRPVPAPVLAAAPAPPASPALAQPAAEGSPRLRGALADAAATRARTAALLARLHALHAPVGGASGWATAGDGDG